MDGFSRSQYLEEQRQTSTDQGYIDDIENLRELIYAGNFGYVESQRLKEDPELKEEYRRLSSRYLEAYRAFGEERRQETLNRCEYSPYLEKMKRGLPDTDENRVRLRDLQSLRHQMILMKLGYGGQGLGMKLHSLKARYPKATETFEQELENVLAQREARLTYLWCQDGFGFDPV